MPNARADGEKLTGKAVREREGEKTVTEIKEGKLSGNDVAFAEFVKFHGQDARVDYKGKVAGDEFKFTRTVAESIKKELVAKRVK